MRNPSVHPVARAFELARSGAFRTRSEIARAMESEGYMIGDCDQLSGSALSRQLTAICREMMPRTGNAA